MRGIDDEELIAQLRQENETSLEFIRKMSMDTHKDMKKLRDEIQELRAKNEELRVALREIMESTHWCVEAASEVLEERPCRI